MSMIYIILSSISLIFSTTHSVPEEYSTIQLGIDAAADGDTVLVNQGIYYENIHITKSIVLTSYAIFDDLENWTEYNPILEEWLVANDNINNTIIDGSTAIDDYGSCVLIYSPSGYCITPEVTGFTIQNGIGTLVTRNPNSDQEEQQRIGAGILFDISDPTISFNQIIDNGSAEVFSGGAAYGTSMEEDWSFNNRDLNGRSRCEVDQFNLENNLYDGNDALYGNTFANVDFEESINMTGSVFDVYDCNEQIINSVSEVWINSEESNNVNYTDGVGQLCAYTLPDVYVDVNIEQECLSQNCGFQNNPFKTIQQALQRINPTEDNPITIHLSPGTYSPETGENFPIPMISNVNLDGQGEGITIIDAQQANRVIAIDDCQNNIISNLTITGGSVEENSSNRGGGIIIYFSNPIFDHVTIIDNTAYHGGGIAMYFSNPIFNHITITENTASSMGGILLYTSNPILNNIIISKNNVSGNGGFEGLAGGIGLIHSNPTLNYVTITENLANEGGGIHLIDYNPFGEPSAPIIHNSIIWGNSAESIFIANSGMPLVTYSDIQGDWEGEGNIDANPLFVNTENGDFSLQDNSPCKDSGNPALWYNDIDGSNSDIGATGGSNILPNFISYDFGDIGDLGAEKQFNLFNYSESAITINSANISSSSFTVNSSFPIIIDPLHVGKINIVANNSNMEYIENEMILISNDLPQGISVSLSLTGAAGNILTGDLSGTYTSSTYRISRDISIASDDIVTLQSGTTFLFDGEYNFSIYGTLIALGTEQDSIIFDNYGTEKWRGLTLYEESDQSEFRYLRISGAQKDLGGGIRLASSSPNFKHVTISGNSSSSYGGGIYMSASNPNLEHVSISENYTLNPGNGYVPPGGGIVLDQSNPTLNQVIITQNTAMMGAGIYFINCNNSTLNNVTISGNSSLYFGGGVALDNSYPIFNHVTISENTAGFSSGGIYLNQSDPQIINSIIWGNTASFGDTQIGISENGGTPLITYSDISGGWIGDGNINSDPLFVDSENGNYTLQDSSPCIDAGITDIDNDGIDDITDFFGSAPDMGAFEYIGVSIPGDLNNDSILNIIDIIALVNIVINNEPYNAQADLNNDSIINIIDVITLVNIIIDL